MLSAMTRSPAAIALAAAAMVAVVGLVLPYAASAQQATCVTLCQEKVDVCASQCESLADAVYRDPASLRQCQLGCAQSLFTSCVQHCSETGEVTQGDYGIVAEDPDRVPAPAPPSR